MEMSVFYFSVKLVSAIYILHKVWAIIFGPVSYDFWDRLLRHARRIRVGLWRKRKKRMVEKAGKNSGKTFVGDSRGSAVKDGTYSPVRVDNDTDDDVIGKTNIVYLEDPDMARKIPVRTMELEKVAIDQDEEINLDDVENGIGSGNGLTESDRQDLMASEESIPDPEFSKPLTFEELNNVAEVLMSATDDRKNIQVAAETLYRLQDTDLFGFFSTEISTTAQVEKLLKEHLDSSGRLLSETEVSKRNSKRNVIDWNKYM